ncbi:MAG: hypothetical protein RJA34_2476 [Pseudomonadota bacterium]
MFKQTVGDRGREIDLPLTAKPPWLLAEPLN